MEQQKGREELDDQSVSDRTSDRSSEQGDESSLSGLEDEDSGYIQMVKNFPLGFFIVQLVDLEDAKSLKLRYANAAGMKFL
jgi:hypothetical protein